jgi:23S rRNA maturation mini-RNase III
MMDVVYDFVKEVNENEVKNAHSWKVSTAHGDMDARLYYAGFLEQIIGGLDLHKRWEVLFVGT